MVCRRSSHWLEPLPPRYSSAAADSPQNSVAFMSSTNLPNSESKPIFSRSRRDWLALTGAACLTAQCGCVPSTGAARVPDLVWGRRGVATDGLLFKPRAMTIDEKDQIYIVDLTGRVQVFDADGKFLRSWKTPLAEQGKPLGLAIGNDGSVIVSDTHYFRVLFYSRDGVLDESRTIDGSERRFAGPVSVRNGYDSSQEWTLFRRALRPKRHDSRVRRSGCFRSSLGKPRE